MVVREIGIRLAIREEGPMCNAYLARIGDMKDALLLGSVICGPLKQDNDLWERWKSFMTDIMANACEEIYGQRPTMDEIAAPQHERAGEA